MTGSRLPVSAYVICCDEVAWLGGCIESLSDCAEIIIVDSGSTDGTLALIEDYIGKGYPIRLFERPWPGYAAQKQFALDQCSQPWCLSLDADERLDEALREELGRLVTASAGVNAWRLDFRLSLYAYGYVPEAVRYGASVRLTRRGFAAYATDTLVHESLFVEGEFRTAPRGKILHARALPLEEQIVKEKTYANLKAKQLLRKGKSPRFFRLVFNPPLYFLKLYLAKRFFLCGWPGFIHAATGAAYAFMAEAMLYQKYRAARRPDTFDPGS
ncbi:MAG: glycosyltransferase family 2 protein [Aquamicrobium sp.]|uniref:glycosyltransferase family 2 protein n=1 Tax=Aquamicrobium sp. TaxID=1872579 RepID=UPI00349EA4D2|nr:glycosyltransferase family 2 protein [Aquamicrobium sp.]